MKKKKPLNPSLPGKFGRMTADDFEKLSRQYEVEHAGEDFKPLSAAGREAHRRASRAGRPRKAENEKVIKINVSFDPGVLKIADAYAKKKKISRAHMIELALMEMIQPHRKIVIEERKAKSA